MPYSLIQSPFNLALREMSVQELKSFYRWFLDVINERIVLLSSTVKITPGFEAWEANYNPESLDVLGEWFCRHVEVRPRTPDEMNRIKNMLLFNVEFSGWELTDKTLSLSADIGMYVGNMLIRRNMTLRWGQILKNKKFVDYGFPVIIGFSNAPLNPIRITVVLAQGVANNKYTGGRLREVYDIWNNLVMPIL